MGRRKQFPEAPTPRQKGQELQTELQDIQTKIAEKILQGDIIEDLFAELAQVETDSAEGAMVRDFARTRFTTLLDEITALRRQERRLAKPVSRTLEQAPRHRAVRRVLVHVISDRLLAVNRRDEVWLSGCRAAVAELLRLERSLFSEATSGSVAAKENRPPF